VRDTITIEIGMTVKIGIPVGMRTRIIREAVAASVSVLRNRVHNDAKAEAAMMRTGTIMKNGE
jgi:hypothetical protein